MCLGVPGKIIEKYLTNDMLMGRIDFGGVYREACLVYVPEAQIGDYVLIHVGFALTILSEEDAKETLSLIDEINSYDTSEIPTNELS